nr:nucleolar protein 58-like [Tanacetum cinerariifolium]
MMRQNKNLLDINIDALYNILKQNQGDVNDDMKSKKKAVVITSDPLALVVEKTKVSKRKVKVKVSSKSKGSDDELKQITALLAKAFNRKNFYSKPTNNNLRTSTATSPANKKQEYVKFDDKKEEKKANKKKRDMSKVKCYNCKKEGHFAKDCKKAKVKDYEYYKTKMLLTKKDKDKQVLFAKDQAWMESSKCDKVENSEVIAPGMFKLNLSQSVSPISMSIMSCTSENVENKTKRKRHLDTFSSVRRHKHSGVIWKKKGSSNTSNVDLSSVSHSKLNKDVKRYSRKDLLSCNNSHLGETSSAYVCNDAMNVSCNSRLYDSFDEDNLFIFDDESIVQICLWIINSGCLKHMMGNRAMLTNFVESFLGTVRFGNNVFAFQLANLFTKSFPEARFKFLVEKLGMMSRET